MNVGSKRGTSLLKSNQRRQFIPVVVYVMTEYSTYVEEWYTISYLLHFQKNKKVSKKAFAIHLRFVEDVELCACRYSHLSTNDLNSRRSLVVLMLATSNINQHSVESLKISYQATSGDEVYQIIHIKVHLI